jgi:hypothetical protein
MSSLQFFQLVGAILGVIAFVWNVWKSVRAYLVLSLDIRTPTDGGDPILRVSTANSGVTSKLISYAVVVATPENLALSDAVERLLAKPLSGSSGVRRQQSAMFALFRDAGGETRYVDGCALIPLREMYGDQAMVGPGETVSYAFSLNKTKLRPGETYVVRFLVLVHYFGSYLRWRFTADALRIPAAPASTGEASLAPIAVTIPIP